jgi:type IV secretory pathway component VirB8
MIETDLDDAEYRQQPRKTKILFWFFIIFFLVLIVFGLAISGT